MKMPLAALLVSLLVSWPVLGGEPETVAIVGITLVDGNGGPPVADAVVVLSGDRIVAAGSGAQVTPPDGARRIDGRGKWLIPGLIDTHIHFFQSAGLYTRPDIIDLTGTVSYREETEALRRKIPETFRRYLAAGITAVVDQGGPFWNFAVRELAAATTTAPRVAVAGPLVATVARPQLDLGDPPIIRAESPDHARKLVKEQLKLKPDLVKIWYILPESGDPAENLPVVAATIDEAHRGGVRVAVHAMQLATARAAIGAGADILVHSIDDAPVPADFAAELARKGVPLIPTLVVYEGYAEVLGGQPDLTRIERELGDPAAVASWAQIPPPATPEEAAARTARVERMAGRKATILANLKLLHDAGVTICAGTDAGNVGTLHGPSLHREFELMVEAGLTPHEVLVTATRNAAMLFSRVPSFGTIEAGKLADMVVLDGDPLADIANLQRIHAVVRGGEFLLPDSLVPPSPETIVQRQVDAYNAREIDRFADYYTQDVEIFRLPEGERTLHGRAELVDKYTTFFEKAVNLNCQIMSRTVSGQFVVDHEFVTGIPDRPRLRAVAIYQVEGSLIRRVWFLPKEE